MQKVLEDRHLQKMSKYEMKYNLPVSMHPFVSVKTGRIKYMKSFVSRTTGYKYVPSALAPLNETLAIQVFDEANRVIGKKGVRIIRIDPVAVQILTIMLDLAKNVERYGDRI